MTTSSVVWVRCFRSLSVALGCYLLVTLPVVASGTSSEAAIRSAYTKLRSAFLKNDAAALSALLAPDFQQHNADGSVETRDAYLKEQTESTRGLLLSSLKLHVTRVTPNGSDARAETTYAYSGTYAVKGISKSFGAVIHVTDDWALTDGNWKLRSTTIHDLISYVDGKIVQQEREQAMPSKAAIDELRTRAVVIPTLALDSDPDQLAAIGNAIGSARIVGMGEGSHGSSQFFAFKDRLFKYLVERKGFTVFAMEANWGAGLNVDRYIKTGQGSAQQAVASLAFWTWNTPEVVDLIQWMRDYNAASGKHPILSFVGIDVQDPMGPIGYLAQYLHIHDPGEVTAARPALQCSVDANAQPRAKPADDCRRQVAAVGKQLSSVGNAPDVAIALQAVTNIIQYLDWKSAESAVGMQMAQIRDQRMAKNLEWAAANYPGEKIAVWAHNGHVGTTPELSYRPMGSYLRQAFGSDYYVIGQTFGGGTVRAIVRGKGLQSVTVPLNSNDTLTALFAPLNAAAFLDFRGLPAGSPLQTFFSTQRDIEEIGAMIDPMHPDQRMPAVVPNSFDGLVYIPTSSAAVSGTGNTQMEREISEHWTTAGAGFDDVTVSATTTQATLTNRDALNATPSSVLRRYDAMPYAGQMVRVTGEIRSDDLLGSFGPMADVKAPDDSVIALSRGNALTATHDGDWLPIALTLKVPRNASSIYAGFWAEGLGSVEVRNLRIDGSSAPASAADPPAPQSPAPATQTPSPNQILSRALEKIRSYPVSNYVVWTNYWSITRTAPQLVTSTTGGWTNKTSTFRRAERFAERTSDGLQNVTWSIPARTGQLPDAHFSSVFEGPFAWSLRPPVTEERATSSPMRPDIAGLKTIASVTAYARPAYTVNLIGTETIDGHNTYHLQLHPLTDAQRHNLRDLWVDISTFDIWKAQFVGKYPALVPYGTPPLVDSDITAYFRQTLTYWIVYRLAWSYDYDGSHLAFDTHIGEIAFPNTLPDWLFDSTAYAQHEKAREPDILYQVLQDAPIPMPSFY